MPDPSVICGCGRKMAPRPLGGPSAFRCGCGATVTVTIPLVRRCGGYRDGGPCRSVPLADHPVDVCAEHAEQLREFWRIPDSRDPVRDPVPASLTRPPVIYYLRFGDRIKIGWTVDLGRRMKAIPYDSLLALEPGGPERERERHDQFAQLRVTGEWFQAAEPLLSHIRALPAFEPPEIPRLGAGELDGDALLTAPEAALAVGIETGTFHKWVSRGHVGRAGLGEDGRPLYRFGDVARAANRPAAAGRPVAADSRV